MSDLVKDGHLDGERIAQLLGSMRRHSNPVKPGQLGLIGQEHLRQRLLGMGIHPESFRYVKKLGGPKSKKSQSAEGDKACFTELPYVVEAAFGWLGEGAPPERRIYTGANWSATIKNPFRAFGTTGEGMETTLADLKVTKNEPVVFVLHLAHPRVEYTDRGKSALLIGSDK